MIKSTESATRVSLTLTHDKLCGLRYPYFIYSDTQSTGQESQLSMLPISQTCSDKPYVVERETGLVLVFSERNLEGEIDR